MSGAKRMQGEDSRRAGGPGEGGLSHRLLKVRRRLHDAWRGLQPARLFALSFAGLILLGTIGFRVLPGLYTGPGLSWLDSLFTAASAVCVTGLIVVDTATAFTPLGQAWVLLLIQLGGMGVITFATWITLSLGQRISLRQADLSLDMGSPFRVEPARLVRYVLRFTLTFEAVGGVLLWALFIPRFGVVEGARHAVFHAVSAFCNAGFSTFSDSLVSYREHPVVLVVVMALIVVGGLGFLSMSELRAVARERGWPRPGVAVVKRPASLTAHTRLVLATTGALLLGGWALYALLEWGGTLGTLPIPARLANSLFMSVTARTAGFNTIDHAAASDGANFLTVLLMTVGGSPGSTAGGIKTTTVALLVLLAFARLRGKDRVDVGSRTVPDATVQRAVGLVVLTFFVLTGSVFLLSAVEIPPAGGADRFLTVLFEAVSALNTVGLSMGLTSDLSVVGRWLVIVLMFVGRVGPLTFAAALSRPLRSRPDIRQAHQDVLIG